MPADELWELIDGVPHAMTVPSADHQFVSVQLTRQLANFFHRSPCQVFHAPYGVFLPKKNESIEKTTNLVIPDLVVVCDEKKRTPQGCRGAPDLVIEILSPSTAGRDRVKKLNLYERFGVKEFWIISLDSAAVMVFRLDADGRYARPVQFYWSDKLTTPLFPALEVDLSEVFPKFVDTEDPETPDDSPPPSTPSDAPAPRVREDAKPFAAPAKRRSGQRKSATKRR